MDSNPVPFKLLMGSKSIVSYYAYNLSRMQRTHSDGWYTSNDGVPLLNHP